MGQASTYYMCPRCKYPSQWSPHQPYEEYLAMLDVPSETDDVYYCCHKCDYPREIVEPQRVWLRARPVQMPLPARIAWMLGREVMDLAAPRWDMYPDHGGITSVFDEPMPRPPEHWYQQTRDGPGGYQRSGTAGGYQRPGTSSGYQRSGTAGGYQRSAPPNGYQRSGTASGYQRPGTSSGYPRSAPPSGYQRSGTTSGYQRPGTSSGYQRPGTAGGYQQAVTTGRYQPARPQTGTQARPLYGTNDQRRQMAVPQRGQFANPSDSDSDETSNGYESPQRYLSEASQSQTSSDRYGSFSSLTSLHSLSGGSFDGSSGSPFEVHPALLATFPRCPPVASPNSPTTTGPRPPQGYTPMLFQGQPVPELSRLYLPTQASSTLRVRPYTPLPEPPPNGPWSALHATCKRNKKNKRDFNTL